MNEFDPESVPIRPAATVMLVDDRPDLQVFMMERNSATVFASGMWVFPGGSVDDTDHPDIFERISTHRSDAEASALLGIEKGGLAYYVAAIREAFEEAGILLALNKSDHTPFSLLDAELKKRFDDYRDVVNADASQLIHIMEKEGLILDAGKMHYIARWITPLGSPRRFDARFFITRMPVNQDPVHDDYELVHSGWFTPQELLDKAESGDMAIMSPQLRMLRSLAKFTSADDVIASASSNQPDERARVNTNRELVLPGDPGYEEGDESIETGWVRLKPIS